MTLDIHSRETKATFFPILFFSRKRRISGTSTWRRKREELHRDETNDSIEKDFTARIQGGGQTRHLPPPPRFLGGGAKRHFAPPPPRNGINKDKKMPTTFKGDLLTLEEPFSRPNWAQYCKISLASGAPPQTPSISSGHQRKKAKKLSLYSFCELLEH